MLIHAKLNGVEEKVEKLLQSEITIKEISEDTGISESILKKLSSGEQNISNAKYGTIQQLYNYYIEYSDNIALRSNSNSDYSHVRLPKKIRDLIRDIDKAIEDVNQNKQTVILAVKDVYTNQKNGNVYLKRKELEINDMIGLGLDETTEPRGVREPYKIIIRTSFTNEVSHINDFKINFDKQKLINVLKQIKHEGGKCEINKEGYDRSIGVYPKDTSIAKFNPYGYIARFESFFMTIEIE
ncbi:hypothetical protein [Staphylococcus aureus]|uniref:hypothetical protein n=1 Tax=Staphylococcus aureus TaxID=1280 RepID=UPI000E3D61C6|nr:hypothetical protein [Staphylococcus aureus]GBY65933.1 hypothetical protein M6K074_2326 [Staphylococcus aureus]GBY65958.1 hypothetical protein M6K074_2351 [Staphylococcus aureus]HDY9569846.1 hypothetical protein [Staphylococcus argenteus]